jgi:hypothetical protein
MKCFGIWLALLQVSAISNIKKSGVYCFKTSTFINARYNFYIQTNIVREFMFTILKRKFQQWRSTIPPTGINRTNNHLSTKAVEHKKTTTGPDCGHVEGLSSDVIFVIPFITVILICNMASGYLFLINLSGKSYAHLFPNGLQMSKEFESYALN